MIDRLRELEADALRLQRAIDALREEVAARSTTNVAEEYEQLKQAVQRYAVACAALDVQVALMRARGDGGKTSMVDLQKCTDEQIDASNALRALGRRLQIESSASQV